MYGNTPYMSTGDYAGGEGAVKDPGISVTDTQNPHWQGMSPVAFVGAIIEA
jgi:hypothetical protein